MVCRLRSSRRLRVRSLGKLQADSVHADIGRVTRDAAIPIGAAVGPHGNSQNGPPKGDPRPLPSAGLMPPVPARFPASAIGPVSFRKASRRTLLLCLTCNCLTCVVFRSKERPFGGAKGDATAI